MMKRCGGSVGVYVVSKLWERLAAWYNGYYVKNQCSGEEIDNILQFFTEYDGYRTDFMCSQVTGYSEKKCGRVQAWLLAHRKLGAYYFEEGVPPQKYMQKYIIENFPEITNDSAILEIGPGDHPLFKESQYRNWCGLDKGFSENENGGSIRFHEYDWGKGKYTRLYKGGWENISAACADHGIEQNFDLVCGSHSYEHTSKPITALREAGKVLKENGVLVLFVPIGFSLNPGNKDFTHTIYLVPEMIEEFFEEAGCFEEVHYETFRPNLDYVITARRKKNEKGRV